MPNEYNIAKSILGGKKFILFAPNGDLVFVFKNMGQFILKEVADLAGGALRYFAVYPSGKVFNIKTEKIEESYGD